MKKTIFNQKTQTWALTQMTNKEIAEWEAQKAICPTSNLVG